MSIKPSCPLWGGGGVGGIKPSFPLSSLPVPRFANIVAQRARGGGGETEPPVRELTFTTCDGTTPLQLRITIPDLIYHRLEPSFKRVSNTFGHPLCISVSAACYVPICPWGGINSLGDFVWK